MKKPAFSFKAAFSDAARRRGSTAAKALSSFRLVHLFGLGKKKAAAPPSAPAAAASPAAAARPPVAKKTAPAATAPAAHRMADEDEEASGTGFLADARRRERARCEAIISSPAGLKNPALAKAIAFESRMTRKEGIALLDSTPGATTMDRRGARIGVHRPDSSGRQNNGAARMDKALAAEMARTQVHARAHANTSKK